MSSVIGGSVLGDVRKYFEQLPEVAEKAAIMALNQVVERDGLAMMRADITSQIAFPNGYLKMDDRLAVTRKARPGNIEAVITARDRPTSLARFSSGQSPESTRKGGVTVQVKRGKTTHLKKAFLVRLKNGNLGLAVRLKPGETLNNKTYGKPVMLAKHVYLLYGPSVDQVFQTVAEESLPELGDMVSKEFYRQFTRLSRGS